RLRGEMQRLQNLIATAPRDVAMPATATAQPPKAKPETESRKYLHPEVDNYLSANDFVLTAPEADMNGTMVRPYGMSQIKGFNVLTENAADLQELWEYCGE